MLASHRRGSPGLLGRDCIRGHVCWPRWGSATRRVLGGALFYLMASVLASSAFFLLVDLVERWQAGATLVDEAPFLSATLEADDVNLDDEEAPLVGRPFPASIALLGLAYLACALLIVGLPPLANVHRKAGDAVSRGRILGSRWDGRTCEPGCSSPCCWAAALLMLIALTRTGIRTFWSSVQREAPRMRAAEGLPAGGAARGLPGSDRRGGAGHGASPARRRAPSTTGRNTSRPSSEPR